MCAKRPKSLVILYTGKIETDRNGKSGSTLKQIRYITNIDNKDHTGHDITTEYATRISI